MATQANKLTVNTRTETGKGAARRARRAGKIPAVLYGHGTDPRHLHLPELEFAAILRSSGMNAVLDLDIEGSQQLALTKQVDIHPIRNFIQHADLLVIRRGEKVTVEVGVYVEGDAAPGTLVVQDASYVEIEADALSIPEQITISVEGSEVDHVVHASDIELPEGVELISDPDMLIVAVNEAPSSAELEEEAEELGAETPGTSDEAETGSEASDESSE